MSLSRGEPEPRLQFLCWLWWKYSRWIVWSTSRLLLLLIKVVSNFLLAALVESALARSERNIIVICLLFRNGARALSTSKLANIFSSSPATSRKIESIEEKTRTRVSHSLRCWREKWHWAWRKKSETVSIATRPWAFGVELSTMRRFEEWATGRVWVNCLTEAVTRWYSGGNSVGKVSKDLKAAKFHVPPRKVCLVAPSSSHSARDFQNISPRVAQLCFFERFFLLSADISRGLWMSFSPEIHFYCFTIFTTRRIFLFCGAVNCLKSNTVQLDRVYCFRINGEFISISLCFFPFEPKCSLSWKKKRAEQETYPRLHRKQSGSRQTSVQEPFSGMWNVNASTFK